MVELSPNREPNMTELFKSHIYSAENSRPPFGGHFQPKIAISRLADIIIINHIESKSKFDNDPKTSP